MLGPLLADGDEGRGLRQAVDLGDLPAELALDALDRRRRGGSSRRQNPDAPPALRMQRLRRIGDVDQDRRRRAQHRHRLCRDRAEDRLRLDAAQAEVRPAHGGHDPHERPAVGVEHGKRPEVAIRRRHRVVQERADDVGVRVAVRDHHALGAGRRSAGVVEGHQIGLGDRGPIELRRSPGDHGLVIEPAGPSTLERDEMLDTREPVAHGIDRVEMVGMGAHDARPAVSQDVGEVLARQPVIDRDEHGPDLRHGVEGLQLRVRVRADRRDTVARPDPQAQQRLGPAVTAIEELRVGQAQVAIDDGLATGIEPARPPCELQGRERRLDLRTSVRACGRSTSPGRERRPRPTP